MSRYARRRGGRSRVTGLARLAALRADDPDALAALFDRYADRIYNHCFRGRRGTGPRRRTRTATVFLEVWRHRGRVEAHDGSALPWLYGVATNVCRNLTRCGVGAGAAARRGCHRRSSPTMPSGSPIVSARRTGMQAVLASIRRDLPHWRAGRASPWSSGPGCPTSRRPPCSTYRSGPCAPGLSRARARLDARVDGPQLRPGERHE